MLAAMEKWNRLRACTVGRARSWRIELSIASFQRRATDGVASAGRAVKPKQRNAIATARIRGMMRGLSGEGEALAPVKPVLRGNSTRKSHHGLYSEDGHCSSHARSN